MAPLPKSTRKRSKLTEFPELDKKGEVTNPRKAKEVRPEDTRAMTDNERFWVEGVLSVGIPGGVAVQFGKMGLRWLSKRYGERLGKRLFANLKDKIKPNIRKGQQGANREVQTFHMKPNGSVKKLKPADIKKLQDDAAKLKAKLITGGAVLTGAAAAAAATLVGRKEKGGKKSTYVNMAEKVNEGEERKARDRANDDPMMSGKNALGKGKTTAKQDKKPQTKTSPGEKVTGRKQGPLAGSELGALAGSIASQLKDEKPTGEMNAPMGKNNSKIGKGDPSSSPDTSSFRKVSGPDGLGQGKRVYKTPFGNITVDSTDEGMWGKGKTSEDAADFKKGGTAKKKKAVSKYGAKAMKFTNRGGMYKVKR